MKIILMFWGLFFRYKTRKYRMELYKRLLIEIEHEKIGFCTALIRTEPVRWRRGWVKRLWMLPELYWYNPFFMGPNDHWYPLNYIGMGKRKAILKEITGEYDKSRKIEQDYDPYYDDRD